MRALIISGGTVDIDFCRDYLSDRSFDRIIAADAGLSACSKLGLVPTEILGDFDSLQDPGLLERAEESGIPIMRFPARKDHTDTDLAFQYCEKIGADHVTVLGATGTRLDHTLANIGLLTRMADRGIECVIADSHNEMEVIVGPAEKRIRKKKDGNVSVLALSRESSGIDMEGFSYPVSDGTFHAFDSLGISNELVEDEGIIRVRKGYLLIICSAD